MHRFTLRQQLLTYLFTHSFTYPFHLTARPAGQLKVYPLISSGWPLLHIFGTGGQTFCSHDSGGNSQSCLSACVELVILWNDAPEAFAKIPPQKIVDGTYGAIQITVVWHISYPEFAPSSFQNTQCT